MQVLLGRFATWGIDQSNQKSTHKIPKIPFCDWVRFTLTYRNSSVSSNMMEYPTGLENSICSTSWPICVSSLSGSLTSEQNVLLEVLLAASLEFNLHNFPLFNYLQVWWWTHMIIRFSFLRCALSQETMASIVSGLYGYHDMMLPCQENLGHLAWKNLMRWRVTFLTLHLKNALEHQTLKETLIPKQIHAEVS